MVVVNTHLMYCPKGNSFFFESPDVSWGEVKGNIRTWGKTKLTSFPRDHTLSALFDSPLNDHVLLYLACGQQLYSCILVRIHLNLIRASDQESTNHSACFVEWKSGYITMVFLVSEQGRNFMGGIPLTTNLWNQMIYLAQLGKGYRTLKQQFPW